MYLRLKDFLFHSEEVDREYLKQKKKICQETHQ